MGMTATRPASGVSNHKAVAICTLLSSALTAGLSGAIVYKASADEIVIALAVLQLVVTAAFTVIPAMYILSQFKASLVGFNETWQLVSALQIRDASDSWNSFITRNPPPEELDMSAKAMKEALFALLRIARHIPRAAIEEQGVASEYSDGGIEKQPSSTQFVDLGDYPYSPHAVPQVQPDWDGDAHTQISRTVSHHTLHHVLSQGALLASTQEDSEEVCDEESEEDAGTDEEGGSHSSSSGMSGRKPSQTKSHKSASTPTAEDTAQSPPSSMRGLTTVIAAKNVFLRAGKIPCSELTARRVTTEVILNTKGFNEFSRSYELETVMKFHSRWLEACITDAKKDFAFVERFIGDEVQVNFGGFVQCSVPGQKAGRYLLKVRERLEQLHQSGDADLGGDNMPATYMGAAQGPAICGNLGWENVKGTAVLGRIVGGAKALQAVARDTGFDIIVDRRISDECQGHISSVPVDVIQVGVDGTPQEVCYLIGRVGAEQNEWLYSITTDVNYDRAWKILRNGDVAYAAELLTQYVQQSRNHTAALVCARIQRFVAEVKRATGEPPKEYCRTVRMMTFTPRPLLSRIPRASIANTQIVLPIPRGGTPNAPNPAFHANRRRKASITSPPNLVSPRAQFASSKTASKGSLDASSPTALTSNPSPVLQYRLAAYRLGSSPTSNPLDKSESSCVETAAVDKDEVLTP